MTSTQPFVRKLYIYEHCPFCIRVRILAGAKNIPLEIKYLQHDDEKGHIDLIGKKMVPILEWQAGKYMGESLDIVKYLDSLPEYGPPLLTQPESDKLKAATPFPDGLYKLGLVAIQNVQFPEFARPSAKAYFIDKKQKQAGMTIEEILANSAKFKADLDKHLQLISSILPSVDQLKASNYAINGVAFSIDDITLGATLCYTTLFKGLTVPDNIQLYNDQNSKRWNTPVFYNVALQL